MTNLPATCRFGLLGVLVLGTLLTDSLLRGAAAEADQIRPGQEFAQKASWKVPTAQSVQKGLGT